MNTHQLSWTDLDEDNHVVEGSESAITALYEIMLTSEKATWGYVVEVEMRAKPQD